jgi:hypothetical protein
MHKESKYYHVTGNLYILLTRKNSAIVNLIITRVRTFFFSVSQNPIFTSLFGHVAITCYCITPIVPARAEFFRVLLGEFYIYIFNELYIWIMDELESGDISCITL